METIRSVNTNSLESCVAMHSGHHEDRISDFKTHLTGGQVINYNAVTSSTNSYVFVENVCFTDI